MAITYDRNEIVFGDQTGRKQTVLTIPAQAASDKPGIVAFQSVNNSGTRTNYYTWFDSNGAYRYHTAIPTDQDSDGSTITSGASTTLNNLGTVACNTTLASDQSNTDDIGTDALPWRSGYFHTSIIFDQDTRNLTLTASEPASSARTVNFDDPGANDSVAYLAASQALTTKTYNGLTVTCATNAITLSNGTASIVLAAGDTDIALAAAAKLDIGAAGNVDFGTGTYNFVGNVDVATGCTVDIDAAVNIDTALTVNTGSVTLNQSLQTTDSPTFVTLTSTTTKAGTLTAAAASITDSSGAISFDNENLTTTGTVNVAADNVNITVGAAGVSDAKIYFNATSLCFWDSETTTTYTLKQLATGTTLNPSVTGDLTISDGKFDWTNATDEVSATWDFANTTNNCINMTPSHLTTGTALTITSTTVAGGMGLHVNFTEAVPLTGSYIQCSNAATPVFNVKRYGATTIAGSAAGTAALTLTAGDIKVTAGYLDVDSPVGNGGHNIASADDGTSATSLITITNSNAAFDQALITVDANATGAINTMVMTNAGTGIALKISGEAAGSKGIEIVSVAGTATMLNLDGATGGAAWVGTDNVGFETITSDGVLVAGANLLRVSATGANTAASFLVEIDSTGAVTNSTDGICLRVTESGAAAGTSYAEYIESTSNSGLCIKTGGTATKGLVVSGPQDQAVNIAYIDGTTGTGWVGASAVGMLHLASDGALAHAGTSLLYSTYTGAIAAVDCIGTCAQFIDAGSASTHVTDVFAVNVNSTNNSGLRVGITTGATGNNMMLVGPSAQTGSMIVMDGTTTNGWGGAAETGMLHLKLDGNTLNTTASAFQIVIGAGTPTDASLGYAFKIADTTVAPANPTSTYAMYASTTSNGLYIATTNITTSALTLAGPTVQTGSIMKIDGTTTDGWIGAPATGMLSIVGDGAMVADASLVRIASSTQPAVANDGICLELVETGVAQTTSYAMRITSTNNEALHVDAGITLFDEGPRVEYHSAATTDDAPTALEIAAAGFPAEAAGFNGYVGVLNDSDHAGDTYLVYCANGSWYFLKGTNAA